MRGSGMEMNNYSSEWQVPKCVHRSDSNSEEAALTQAQELLLEVVLRLS